MPDVYYNKARRDIPAGAIDLLNDTLRVMLVQSGYVANADHDAIDMGGANDPVDHELTVTNYARQTLASKTLTEDDANDRAVFDAADVVFGNLAIGQSIAGAILFQDTGTATTSTPIYYFDLRQGGEPVPTAGVPVTVQWGANGLAVY